MRKRFDDYLYDGFDGIMIYDEKSGSHLSNLVRSWKHIITRKFPVQASESSQWKEFCKLVPEITRPNQIMIRRRSNKRRLETFAQTKLGNPTVLFLFAAAVLGYANANIANAGPHPVCQLLTKEDGPVAFLLDPAGNVSDGPVDFGRIAYKHQETGHLVIPTGYKMVIAPARLKISNCHSECVVLKEVTSTCSQAKTYAISYVMPDNEEFDNDRSWLPYKEETNGRIFSVRDPIATYDPEVKYKFHAKIIGEIYDPKKQQFYWASARAQAKRVQQFGRTI